MLWERINYDEATLPPSTAARRDGGVAVLLLWLRRHLGQDGYARPYICIDAHYVLMLRSWRQSRRTPIGRGVCGERDASIRVLEVPRVLHSRHCTAKVDQDVRVRRQRRLIPYLRGVLWAGRSQSFFFFRDDLVSRPPQSIVLDPSRSLHRQEAAAHLARPKSPVSSFAVVAAAARRWEQA